MPAGAAPPPTLALPEPVAALARELAALPGAVAVVLGGSRASGTHRPDSDWDLGLYYRASAGSLDPAAVRALGHRGHVSGLGEWGPVMHGGAWLTLGGLAVDVLFRDLDVVERHVAAAERGEFEVLPQAGYLAGAPGYVPAGELAVSLPVAGGLPRPGYPDALARRAPDRWRARAATSLMFARIHAGAPDAVGCAGMLAQAVLCVAHARLAERREGVLNEKRLVARAGLASVQARLGAAGTTAGELEATVAAVSAALGVEPLAAR
jgi:hypothetical protein